MPERLDFSRANARSEFTSKRRRRLSLALALILAGLPAATASAIPSAAPAQPTVSQPGPALWVVSDADTTVYLFGTFHALDARSSWFNRNIRAAFDASESLVLETIVPEDPAELQAVLARNSLAQAPQAGKPLISADRAPSFVASAGQAMAAGRSMGMSVEQGADAVLRRAATRAGKQLEGLESFEFQLRMFASLPAGPSPRPTSKAAPSQMDLRGQLSSMQSAWARGDNSSFAAILGSMQANSPATYKALFVDRNANWAGWIADRMQKPGTVFVAVGTGHLIGQDSVQATLARRGFTSARIS